MAGPVFAAELTYGDRDLIEEVIAVCRVDLKLKEKLKECFEGVIASDSEVLMLNRSSED